MHASVKWGGGEQSSFTWCDTFGHSKLHLRTCKTVPFRYVSAVPPEGSSSMLAPSSRPLYKHWPGTWPNGVRTNPASGLEESLVAQHTLKRQNRLRQQQQQKKKNLPKRSRPNLKHRAQKYKNKEKSKTDTIQNTTTKEWKKNKETSTFIEALFEISPIHLH